VLQKGLIMMNTFKIHKSGTSYLIPYFAFWLAIGMTFEAVYLLSPDADVLNAIKVGVQVIGSATLLGLIVLQVAMRSPMPREKMVLSLGIHAFGAILFSVLWIVTLVFILGIEKLITTGAFSYDIPPTFVLTWHMLAGSVMYVTIVSTVMAGRSYAKTQHILRNAELQVMRARLNPHFLFNTLHTIMILFRRDTNKAEQAMEQFSDLIRYTFHNDDKYQVEGEKGPVTLEKEWNICTKYLELEKLRLGDNLKIITDIDPDALRFVSPQLLLQPLIENAIIHGVANNENGGTIEVKLKYENDEIIIDIVNSLEKPNHKNERETSGLGLNAVKASLEDTFGRKAVLKTETVYDTSFRVNIKMPAEVINLK
jgi:hypothetical protein